MAGTVLAVDGTNLAHRAWHAARESGPAATNMVGNWIARSCDQVSAAEVVVAFDGDRAGHWRYEILPTYKSGRKEKSEEFKAYLANLPKALAEAGWCVFTPSEFEADDVLAAVAHQRSDVVLLSGDRDSLALSCEADILTPGTWVRLDAAAIEQKLGFSPARYPFYASVKGDSSDKIPGVKGLGEKAAKSLVMYFSCVEDFLSDLAGGGELTAQALSPAAAKRLSGKYDEVASQARLSEAVISFRRPEGVPYAAPVVK